MSDIVIHILLLDGKILCVYCKNISTRILIKHLCKYLNLQRPQTVGLLYKDARGSLQWMKESEYILDHDIDIDHEFIQLIFKIRYVPHHLCYNESNVHQLFLLSVRLLKQNWFKAQIEIHSQLIALYILFKYGSMLDESEIYDAIQECNFSVDDPISNTNLLRIIIDAFNNYKSKLSSFAGYIFKFLYLALSFPIVNSKLFVVSDSKGQNWVLGINSVELTLFQLEQYHSDFMKYRFSNIEKVMNRGIKIVIDMKYNKKRSMTPSRYLENEMVTFYALTAHQSLCIYNEILSSQDQFQESPSVYKISDMMKNPEFYESFNSWLYDKYFKDLPKINGEYNADDIFICFEKGPCSDEDDIEILFGEIDMYNSDIYLRLHQPKTMNSDIDIKPDLQQLLSEKRQLKDLLQQKMIQLQELFAEEEKITGIRPIEVLEYFPNWIPKFQRNGQTCTLNYSQHRGCAASVRNKLMAEDYISRQGTIKSYDKLASSRSVTDLSSMNNYSRWKTKSDSSSSLKSFEDNMSNIGNKSSGNSFFTDSKQTVANPKTKKHFIPKFKSQSNNMPQTPPPKPRIYNSISPSFPRSDVFLSSPPNRIPSTHSSPIMYPQKSKKSSKRYNRSFDRK